VSAVYAHLGCTPGNHTATAVVRVEYDGTAGATLTLTWWRNSSGSPEGATTMTPQTVKLPKGSTSYVFTSNFTYQDTPKRPYIGVTATTAPAAATGARTEVVRCR
jgi:hypothetical protein